MKLDAAKVASALERLVKSETFARSERARDLVAYLVAKEQAGEGGLLKGFSIAQDVFGRDNDFDPATDAVVRVQAGRLRELLATYYGDEGAKEELEISIPRGGYCPEYIVREIAPEPIQKAKAKISEMDFGGGSSPLKLTGEKSVQRPEMRAPVVVVEDTAVSPFIVRNIRRFWAVLLSILGLLGLILLLLWQFGSEVTRQGRSGNDTQADRSPGGPERTGAMGDLGQWTTGLPTVAIGTRAAADQSVPSFWQQSLESAASRFASIDLRTANDANAGYMLVATAETKDKANLELIHQPSGSLIWAVQAYSGNWSAETDGVSIGGALTSVLTSSGQLYADAAKRNGLSPLARCHWLTESYFLKQSKDLFVEAYDCHRGLDIAGQVSPLIHSDLASLLEQRVTDKLSYPESATIDDAMRQARRSLEVEPTAEGYRSLASILETQQDYAGAEEAIRKAIQLNPYNVHIQASYGYALLRSGAYAESEEVISRAIHQVDVVPSWWSYTHFASAFLSDNLDAAYRASDALAGETNSHYLAARLIAAHGRGVENQANSMREALEAKFSGRGWSAARYYARLFSAEGARKFIDALAAAGYTGPPA